MAWPGDPGSRVEGLRSVARRGALGGAIGVRETLLVVTIAAVTGVLWLVGSPVLRLRDLPDVPE